jgi:hypothetical protein
MKLKDFVVGFKGHGGRREGCITIFLKLKGY